MKVLVYLIFLVVPISILAQFDQESCGTTFSTDPHFDRLEFERFKEDFLQNRKIRNQEVLILPININIVRHSDQSGGFDPSLVKETLDTVNARYLAAGLQFELCDAISFIDRDILYDFDRSLYLDSLISYNQEGVINVFYINKVVDDASIFCGFASFPWRDSEYVVVKNSCALNGSTLAHELGHYFGLYHTHETALGIELADGSNCVFAGDELCDTPADPRLGTGNVDIECEYTGMSRDGNGDRFQPDPTNIMSYSRKECRTYFSPEQLARIKFYQERFRSHLNPCAVTSTKIERLEGQFLIYPNPSSDYLEIQWNPDQRDWHMIIRSIDGRQVDYYQSIPQTIDVHQLKPGVYYLLFTSSDGVYRSQRFIKT